MNAYEPLWVMVEGVDGAGKTTIVQKAAIILGRLEESPGGVGRRPVVVQCLSFNTPRYDYLSAPLTCPNCHILQDRGVISGPVYEPIMRDDQERLSWMISLVPQAAELGATVLFVDAHIDTLIDRVSERGDDYVDISHLKRLQDGYYREMDRWQELGGKFTVIDTTDHFPDELEITLALSLLQ